MRGSRKWKKAKKSSSRPFLQLGIKLFLEATPSKVLLSASRQLHIKKLVQNEHPLLSSEGWSARPVRKVKIQHVGGGIGKFLCLLWQHCRRSWSFIYEPCSLDSDRTDFVWVRRVWNSITDPKSRQMRGAFRHKFSQHKSWTSTGNSQTNCCCFGVTLWIGKLWRSGAVNCAKEGLMFTTNKRAMGRLWSPAGGRLLWLGDTEAGSKT
jgi:hypothetical protein